MAPVRKITLAAMLVVLSSKAAMAAPPSALTTAKLLDFCRSTTVAEAESKGNLLGWRKTGDADNNGWREGFLGMNGGTVDIVTWRRGENDADGILSFWVANGESRHRACSYSTGTPDGLLDSLKQEFGTPTDVLNHDFGEVVTWTQGSMEVSFSRVNSSAGIVISYKF